MMCLSFEAQAQMLSGPKLLMKALTDIPYVSPLNLSNFELSQNEKSKALKSYCKTLKKYYGKYNWKENPCGETKWDVELKSVQGHPLIYKTFGSGENVTLVLGGVHPDELTPIHLAFKFVDYLEKHPKVYEKNNFKIVVAPLVNPDGFFIKRPTRTNSNKVDVNRNFFTLDWYDRAVKSWERRNGRLRYFPGYFPNSEIETLFQVKLIDRLKPRKIVSIHAPLGFLDYDGPGDQKPRVVTETEKQAKHLVKKVSKDSKNYRIVDYSFFPGSLGNYAGKERRIATITLELETADPNKVNLYWQQFLPGLLSSIKHPFKPESPLLNGDASNFFARYRKMQPKGKKPKI